MCLPIAALAIASMVAGTVVSAVGQIQAGNYANAIARQNARNLTSAARDAVDRGEVASGRQGQETRRLMGAQRAAGAASGIDLSSGSALDILVATAGIGEQDAQTIRNNAAREAWGYRTQAAEQVAQGKLAKRQGLFGAGSTLLTGLSSAGMQARSAGMLR